MCSIEGIKEVSSCRRYSAHFPFSISIQSGKINYVSWSSRQDKAASLGRKWTIQGAHRGPVCVERCTHALKGSRRTLTRKADLPPSPTTEHHGWRKLINLERSHQHELMKLQIQIQVSPVPHPMFYKQPLHTVATRRSYLGAPSSISNRSLWK